MVAMRLLVRRLLPPRAISLSSFLPLQWAISAERTADITKYDRSFRIVNPMFVSYYDFFSK
jgi:hypothetical protein